MQEDMWKPRFVVGKKPIPKSQAMPLGHSWDKGIGLGESLQRAAKNRMLIIGVVCRKEVNADGK